MTVEPEEIPVLTRPISKAERASLVDRTNAFLEKASRKTHGSLVEMDKFNRKATIYFVQACYGFYIIQDLSPNENRWRSTILKYFPRIALKRAAIFAHIGEYFNFTTHYSEFLLSINYPINPNKTGTEDVEPQLARLETSNPPLSDVTPQGLEEYFKALRPTSGGATPGTMPTVPSPISEEPSEQETTPSEAPVTDAPATEETSAEASPDEEIPAPEESLFNEEDLRFDKLLDEFAGRVALPATTVQVFEKLKGMRPIEQWNPAKVSRIREALLPAKLILDALG